MSNTTDFKELQVRAQSYGEHLDRQSMTMAAALLAFLGTGVIFATTESANKVGRGFLFLAGMALALALLPHMLMRIPRQYVVPNPSKVGRKSRLHRVCLKNTMSWNRVRSWALASSWISLLSVLLIMVFALQDGLDGSPTTQWESSLWLNASIIAATISYVLLVGVAIRCAVELFGRRTRQEDKHLRSRRLLDLAGYRPRKRSPATLLKYCIVSTCRSVGRCYVWLKKNAEAASSKASSCYCPFCRHRPGATV